MAKSHLSIILEAFVSDLRGSGHSRHTIQAYVQAVGLLRFGWIWLEPFTMGLATRECKELGGGPCIFEVLSVDLPRVVYIRWIVMRRYVNASHRIRDPKNSGKAPSLRVFPCSSTIYAISTRFL